MKILIADDAEAVRLPISRFASTQGHECLLADDGRSAVAVFQATQPDLVLLDVRCAGGGDAVRHIKRLAAERWVPIILIAAVGDEARLAEAMEAGAEDYLLKPLNLRMLGAKLNAMQRTMALNHKVREQSRTLADYFERAEEEKRVAHYLMDQMVNRERLADQQLSYYLASAESLSGDLIAAARTPGNVLHLILADGIGHGLTAALNVLPITQPFYAMTEHGFAPADILVEIAEKVRAVLPLGRFVAMCFVAVDFDHHIIQVWNAGMPAIRLLDASGKEVCHWPSMHLPMGVASDMQLDLSFQHTVYVPGGHLLLSSDGLPEARNASGECFGIERMLAACTELRGEALLRRVVAELKAFTGKGASHDDISLAVVDLADTGLSTMSACIKPEADWQAPGVVPDWQYTLSLGESELSHTRAVPQLMYFISQLEDFPDAYCRDVFLLTSSLFRHAQEWGLGECPWSPLPQHRPDSPFPYQSGPHKLDISLSGFRSASRLCVCVCVSDNGKSDETAVIAAEWRKWLGKIEHLSAMFAYTQGGHHREFWLVFPA